MVEEIMAKFVYKHKTAVITVCLTAFVLFSGICSGDVPGEADLFEDAYNYYLAYQPDKALELLNMFLRIYPESSAADAVLFWKAKSLIQLRRTDTAREVFLALQKKFPDSFFKVFAQNELEKISASASPAEGVKASPDNSGNTGLSAETRGDGRNPSKPGMETESYALKLSRLEGEKKELGKKLDRERQESEKLRAMIENSGANTAGKLDSEIKKLREQIKASEREDEERMKLIRKISEAKNIFETRLKESESRVSDLNAKVANLEELLEKQRGNTKGDDECAERVEQARRQFVDAGKDMKSKIETAETTIAGQNISLDELTMQYNELRKKYETILLNPESGCIERETLSKLEMQDKAPVIKLDGGQYPLSQIVKAETVSSRALSKMDIKDVLWRTGNIFENFITEKKLFEKAKNEGVRIGSETFNNLSAKFSLDNNEKAYLWKYLMIDKLLNAKRPPQDINEQDLREYYETHKEKFLISPEVKKVQSLIMSYSEKDEARKAKLAIKFYHDALNGKSLNEIYKTRPDVLVFKEIKYEELPNWIKEKTKHMESNNINELISTSVVNGQFIITKIIVKKQVYRQYKDVRSGIEKILKTAGKAYAYDRKKWIEEILHEHNK